MVRITVTLEETHHAWRQPAWMEKHPGVPGIDYWNSCRSKHEESRQRRHLWHLCCVCCFFSFRGVSISFTIFLTTIKKNPPKPWQKAVSPWGARWRMPPRTICRSSYFFQKDKSLNFKGAVFFSCKMVVDCAPDSSQTNYQPESPKAFVRTWSHISSYGCKLKRYHQLLSATNSRSCFVETRKKKGGELNELSASFFLRQVGHLHMYICIYHENDGFLWS